jgi:hypothetical protein
MALHNWFYGGELIIFTSTTRLAMSMPPEAYSSALMELLRFDLGGEHVRRAAVQISGWLAGPSELRFMAPVNAIAIALLLRMGLRRETDPLLRLIAGATAIQQCVGLFFLTAGRYYYFTWFLTWSVVMVWLRVEGLDLLQRRFPEKYERLMRHRLTTTLAQWLERAAGWVR